MKRYITMEDGDRRGNVLVIDTEHDSGTLYAVAEGDLEDMVNLTISLNEGLDGPVY